MAGPCPPNWDRNKRDIAELGRKFWKLSRGLRVAAARTSTASGRRSRVVLPHGPQPRGGKTVPGDHTKGYRVSRGMASFRTRRATAIRRPPTLCTNRSSRSKGGRGPRGPKQFENFGNVAAEGEVLSREHGPKPGETNPQGQVWGAFPPRPKAHPWHGHPHKYCTY